VSSRIAIVCASLALIGATLSPLVRDPGEPRDDSFPLSTYPMFASPRSITLAMHYALGEGRAGQRIALSPEMLGSGEVLQAVRVLERGVAGGKQGLTRLCTEIAARVARDHAFDEVANVRIVIGTHDAVDYLVRDTIGREAERVRCPVLR
jgi:hypothetical protein